MPIGMHVDDAKHAPTSFLGCNVRSSSPLPWSASPGMNKCSMTCISHVGRNVCNVPPSPGQHHLTQQEMFDTSCISSAAYASMSDFLCSVSGKH
jgi:hypothetical protein